MLSISGIKSAGGAANYYGKDDYYVTGEADSPGLTWGGKGSERAGLKGTSTAEQFRSVLNGSHPAFNEGKPGQINDRHRPGHDLTLSAPKSVSILALVGGDHRLLEVHRQSVAAAMAYVEDNFSITRVRQGDGTIKEVRTGNLVYATTEHQTSRAADPQLHSHNVTANKTFDAETGKWRALETQHLYKNFKTAGLVYQATLAKGVMELGYNVVKDVREGTFEIAGVPRGQIEAFSKRHADIQSRIEATEKAKGRSLTPAEREVIVLKDRPSKLDHPRSELEDRWRQEAKDVGMDLGSLIDGTKSRGMGADLTPRTSGMAKDSLSLLFQRFKAMTGREISPHDPYAAPRSHSDLRNHAGKALSYAIRVLEQGKTVFSQHEVLAQALRLAPAGVTHTQVLASAHALQDDGRLRQADKTVLDGMTTKRALALEKEVISRIEEGRGVVPPCFTNSHVGAALDRAEGDASVGIKLDEKQRAAAVQMLTSMDRYTGIQGSAGVGKTTMLRAVRAAARNEQFIGLAAQHDAAQVLQKEAGIPSRTLESLIGSIEREVQREGPGLANLKAHYSNKTLIIDESSMKSNAQMVRLMRAMEAVSVKRAVFVGDQRQLGSPEAGAPFRHALMENLNHAVMDNIRRQKDPVLLGAVKHLAKGEVSPAMRLVLPHVTALGRDTPEAAYAKAAHDAWETGRANNREPRIIVPTNSLRGAVAVEIRKTLISKNELGEGGDHSALRSDRMATAEKHRAESYHEGHILVFHAGLKSADVKKDAHLTVVGRDLRNNLLIADGKDGQRHHIDLNAVAASRHSYFEPFVPKTIEVREGERLVWDRIYQQKDSLTGELAKDFKVGSRFTVEKIEGDRWTVRDEQDQRHVLHKDDQALKFISYGYAETADRAQGKTFRDVLAILGSNHGEAATASRFYVQLSRTSETFGLITNDVKSLTMRLNNQDGLNLIASRELADIVQSAVPTPSLSVPEQAQGGPGLEAGPTSPTIPQAPEASEIGKSDKAIEPAVASEKQRDLTPAETAPRQKDRDDYSL